MQLIILFNILGNMGQLLTNYKLHTYTDVHIQVLLPDAGASEAGNHSGCEDRLHTSPDTPNKTIYGNHLCLAVFS